MTLNDGLPLVLVYSKRMYKADGNGDASMPDGEITMSM